MKNIGAGVDDIFTQVKKEEAEEVEEVGSRGEEDKYEEKEEYIKMKNNMFFYLKEDSTYRISAVAIWSENARGETIDPPHIYYRNILSGKICVNLWACRLGVAYDVWSEEKWDMLTVRIACLRTKNLRQIVCHEKKYAVHLV